MSGAILVLSGPSGCGKSSLVNEILKLRDDIYFSISTTTREIRDGESEGINYHYISKDQFEKEIKEDMFLEWAEVHGNYYGTSLKPVKEALDLGKLVIFDIDVQGHEIVKSKFDDILTSLFITTPSSKILKDRLIGRSTDSLEIIEQRLINSKEEMSRIKEYDYLLVNDKFDESLEKFKSIVNVSLMKVDKNSKDRFINEWYNI
jgi:guanylate kinase